MHSGLASANGVAGWRLLGAALVLAVVAGSTAPIAAADEADEPDHLVQVGAVPPEDPLKPYVYQEYFPSRLSVHRGDRVRWQFARNTHDSSLHMHTVTFASDPGDVPFVRADELPGTFAWDERSFFSSGCGRSGQPVCVVTDPDVFVSSGTPSGRTSAAGIEPFDAVIDLPAGTYSYFCAIHSPAMQGTIEVVDDKVDVANPAPETFSGRIAELTAEADAMVAELSAPAPVDDAGQRTWTVATGPQTRDEGGVGVLGYVPASLSIRAGDTVRWVNIFEDHGVTFPATEITLYVSPNCDFDEPGGGLPGVPLLGFAGCPDGSTLEFGVSPAGSDPHPAPGNAVLTPTTYHNSGMMIAADAPERLRGKPPGSGEHFPSEFDALFPVPAEDAFSYRCNIHPLMTGSISVEAG